MKNLLYVLGLLITIQICSCKKASTSSTGGGSEQGTIAGKTFVTGYITGEDDRACMCCGGVNFKIDGSSIPFLCKDYNTTLDSILSNGKLPVRVSFYMQASTQNSCGLTDSVIHVYNLKELK